MQDAHHVSLAQASSHSHLFQLLLSEKFGLPPQFKLKLSQTFNRDVGPELQRIVTLPMKPAVIIARAIIAADEAYQAAGAEAAPERIAARAARASTFSAVEVQS